MKKRISIHLEDQAKINLIVLTGWFFLNIKLWFFWMKPENREYPLFFWPVTLIIFLVSSFFPAVFLHYFDKKYTPGKKIQARKRLKDVAIVALSTPESEDIKFTERQLKILSNRFSGNDCWILTDIRHSPEIEELAFKYNVYYFSRHDVERWGEMQINIWNSPTTSYMTDTLILNAWLERYGDNYSHFAQLDIYQISKMKYLYKVLGVLKDNKTKDISLHNSSGYFDNWIAGGVVEQFLDEMRFYGVTLTHYVRKSFHFQDTSNETV